MTAVIYKTRLLTVRTHPLRVAYLTFPPLCALASSHSRSALLHTTSKRNLDTERASHSKSSPSNPPFPPLPLSKSSTSLSSQIPPPSVPPPIATPRKRITLVRDLPPQFGRNQIVDVPAQVALELQEVMKQFKAPIRYAFGYGSGVFKQSGYKDDDKPLLDFVFAVSHPSHWHAVNMQQHPSHYSLTMRLLGSDAVAWMQEKGLGAGVWFNVGVEVAGKRMKYGCISIDALCRDLLDWETLYISGRTQKPVRILVDDARVRLANQVNLASALRTSLLLLPSEFTELELYETIAGLSYRGDFRMKVGENPQKVRNIVRAQLDNFRSLYGGLLKSFSKSVSTIGEKAILGTHDEGVMLKMLKQDRSVRNRGLTASKLPIGLRGKLLARYESKMNLKKALGKDVATLTAGEEKEIVSGGETLEDMTALWQRIVSDPEFDMILDRSLAEIVGKPTFNQSLKGILSAGPIKSLAYVGPKLKKKWFPNA